MPVVPVQPQYFTINKTRYQHASLELNFGIPGFQAPVIGIQSVDYDEELKPGELKGASPAVLAVTTGEYKASGKLKLPKAEGAFLIGTITNAALANPDPITGLVAGWGQYQWNATLNYYDIGQPLQTDQWFGARIQKSANSSKVGPDPLYTEFDLFLMFLSQNGNAMVNPATVGAAWLGADV